jgi:probable rRNA maturation factor
MHDALEHTGATEHDEPGSSAEGEGPPEQDIHPAQPTNTIQIDAGDLSKAQADALSAAIDSAVPHLDRDVSRIGLLVVDDAAMIELHQTWHAQNTTTDVLTFESDTHGPLDVDIAVCIDEARRQSELRGHGVQDELLLYVLHGLLHCCGHDDHTDDDRRRMFGAQDDLLIAIGRAPISENA